MQYAYDAVFWLYSSTICFLYRHYLLILDSKKVVHLLDIPIMNLLQFILGILLVVLRESVLYRLLQFVLDFSAHVAHLHLYLLADLVTLLC